MNCKPGDLAVVTTGYQKGQLCECLESEYSINWILPDRNIKPISIMGVWWAVKWIGPVLAIHTDGSLRKPKGLPMMPDSWLKPLPGIPDDVEETDDLEVVA